ncbi:MAG: ferric reductase-like transmembrane domain-containing protein [Gemmatimonadales bacterium]|nr:ferric reductase-like transmembrane domain-containing protein [Gemmatimonadales bacterium]
MQSRWRRVRETPAATGVLWIALYVALVVTPLLVLFIDPTSPGGGVVWDVGIALGFGGLAMLGVQFFLTARFRRATAPYGIDLIYYFHRYLGIVALIVLVAHPALLWISNPAVAALFNPMTAPWHITAGTLSLAAVAGLAVSSLLRRQLGLEYDLWRVGHTILAIVAVGLALWHVHGVGYYVASPWARALWLVIGASLIAVVAWIRLVRPWLLRRKPYRVISVVPERGDAWTLALEPVNHNGVRFQPGQFAWLTLRHSPFAMKEHPFSFSSSPDRDGRRIEFTIKELGDFSRTIKSVLPGEIGYVDGPYGAFTIDRHPATYYVFIAGGIGIAPIMSMLRGLADRAYPHPVLLLYAYSRWDRMTFRESLDELTTRLSLTVVPVLDEPPEGWSGEHGWITREILERHLPRDRGQPHYFICGPEAMTQAMERLLKSVGVPLRRIHSELFNLV